MFELPVNTIKEKLPIKPEVGVKEKKEQVIKKVLTALDAVMVGAHENEHFHNENHPKEVAEDGHSILDIFKKYGLENQDANLVLDTAAAGHDVIIEYIDVSNPKAFNYGQRLRFRGFEQLMPSVVQELTGDRKGNEEASWLEVKKIVTDADPEGLIYTPLIMEKIKAGIGATYPDAVMTPIPTEELKIDNPKNTEEQIDLSPYLSKDDSGNSIGLKFDQPLLTPESDLSTLAIAFGDLMYGGKADAQTFRRHGNEEFRELNDKLGYELQTKFETLIPDRKAQMARAMLGWIRSQAGFLLWQKIRFNQIIENFKAIKEIPNPDGLKNDLRQLYGNFDFNLLDTKERIEESENKYGVLRNTDVYNTTEGDFIFRELAAEMGYSLSAVKVSTSSAYGQ